MTWMLQSVFLGVMALLCLVLIRPKSYLQVLVIALAALNGTVAIFLMHLASSGQPSLMSPPQGAEVGCANINGEELDLIVNGTYYRVPLGPDPDAIRRLMSSGKPFETGLDDGEPLHAEPQLARPNKGTPPPAMEYVR